MLVRLRRFPWLWTAAGVIILDLGAGLLLFHRLVAHPATWTLDSGHSDSALFVWWLRWAPFSVGHGLNPLYTRYWNAPAGIDAMWNTSVLAIGMVLAPVTLLFGAVASYNVASILGPALTASGATWWLTRHHGLAAAVVGGLLFGFSPFEVQQANGHIHVTWLVLMPVMVMLAEDVFWRAEVPWRRSGPLLGLAVAVQWFISTEIVVITAIGVAVGLLFLVVPGRALVRERLKPALAGLAAAAGVAGILLALPLADQFSPSHVIRGPLQRMNVWQSRAAFLVDAPATLRFHTAAGAEAAFRHVGYENGMYVGIPLLVLLAAAIALLWRRPGVVAAGGGAVVMFVLSLGGAGPWRLVEEHIGALQSLLPLRFGAFMWLDIAFVVAAAVDVALGVSHPVLKWGLIGLAGLCLIPLLPAGVGRIGPVVRTPRFFTTSQVDVIPQGANVLVVPMPLNKYVSGLIWQADAGMRFAQPAAMAFQPVGADHSPVFGPQNTALLHWFAVRGPGAYYKGPVTPADDAAIHRALAASRVSVVVLATDPGLPGQYQLLESVFHRPPDRTGGGVALWWVTGPPGHSLR